MLLSLSKPPVYRVRAATGTDSYGDPFEDWDLPERVRLKGAYLQDVETLEEESPSRRVIRGERALFVPGAVDLVAADRIEAEGQVWEVAGDPSVKRGLASAVYTAATLTRVDG